MFVAARVDEYFSIFFNNEFLTICAFFDGVFYYVCGFEGVASFERFSYTLVARGYFWNFVGLM